MGVLPLQAAVFSILRMLIEDRSGIKYEDADAELLAIKLSPRAIELGFNSLLEYYYFLRYDPKGPEELDLLLEALVVHETFFFREPAQLSLLVDTFLAPKIQIGLRPRVWCAAASSGEEPYTLAMLLAERDLLGRLELIASDLSRRALDRARAGIYGGRSLRAVVGTVADRWLVREGSKARIVPALANVIDWRRINLMDAAEVEALGQFDAILCRNVLIYFGALATARVVKQLTASLKADGALLVGASESLGRLGTSLRCEERSGSYFYRKTS